MTTEIPESHRDLLEGAMSECSRQSGRTAPAFAAPPATRSAPLALLENATYDEDGNFLAGSLMDYPVPTAMEIPHITIEHLHSEPLDEFDFRGVGEGGAIATPPAVVNAIADALGGHAEGGWSLPLTPTRILDLIDAAGARP